MKRLLLNVLFSVSFVIASYLISGRNAHADNWGCVVILCLSSPGGPTQFAECRTPIQKLWRELAKGRSFPTCIGVGFQNSRPGYQPHYCEAGYRLSGSYGPHGQEATCVSASLQRVSNSLCSFGRDHANVASDTILSPRWQDDGDRLQCMGYPIVRPNVRPQPHFINVTIDGVGQQRVW